MEFNMIVTIALHFGKMWYHIILGLKALKIYANFSFSISYFAQPPYFDSIVSLLWSDIYSDFEPIYLLFSKLCIQLKNDLKHNANETFFSWNGKANISMTIINSIFSASAKAMICQNILEFIPLAVGRHLI